jgi:hypothetical protein
MTSRPMTLSKLAIAKYFVIRRTNAHNEKV